MKHTRRRAARSRRPTRQPALARPAPRAAVVPTVVPVVMVGSHEGLVDVGTAARFLGLKPSLVYEWVRTNRLPSYKIGAFRKFRISELAAWLEQQRDGAGEGRDGA